MGRRIEAQGRKQRRRIEIEIEIGIDFQDLLGSLDLVEERLAAILAAKLDQLDDDLFDVPFALVPVAVDVDRQSIHQFFVEPR
jgi:hypothetical protein